MSFRSQRGFTLIEMMVVVGLIGVLAALAVPQLRQWMNDNRVRETAMTVGDAFHIARTEAMRTGNNHIVFLGADIGLNALLNANGEPFIRILDDGPPTGPPDCTANAGEAVRDFVIRNGVNIGVTNATVTAPLDTGLAPSPLALSFSQPSPAVGNPLAAWVLFGPDGIPVGLTAACVQGRFGTGGGAVYVTNGRVDYAIVLTQLGAVRINSWERGNSTWN